MTTIRTSNESPVPAARVLAAARDFSARRADVFPAVSVERLEVHELREEWADVTEGTPAGIGINWERCRYDWSQAGIVTATVLDSNVYGIPGSSWEIRATPCPAGSRVEMTWVRVFRSGIRGAIFGTLFRLVGRPIFNRYARQTLQNLTRLEQLAK
jgi:hypothetical protein